MSLWLYEQHLHITNKQLYFDMATPPHHQQQLPLNRFVALRCTVFHSIAIHNLMEMRRRRYGATPRDEMISMFSVCLSPFNLRFPSQASTEHSRREKETIRWWWLWGWWFARQRHWPLRLYTKRWLWPHEWDGRRHSAICYWSSSSSQAVIVVDVFLTISIYDCPVPFNNRPTRSINESN